jgi:hypothetical protein
MNRVQPVNPADAGSSSSRPCLYLGPGGERCSRPAEEDGFCKLHGPERDSVQGKRIARGAVAVLGILVALWPFIVDVIRAIIRLLR